MNANKRPLRTILVLIIIYVLIIGISIENSFKNTGLSAFQIDCIDQLIKNTLIVILSIFAIKKSRVFELSGLDRKFQWSNRSLAFIPVYLLIVGSLQLFNSDFSTINFTDILLLFVATMSVGFSEEFVFRGLINAILIKKYINAKNGVFLSIFLPAVLFGLLHLLDFKISNLSSEISQFLYAIFFGVFFGAVLYRTNRLLPIAIMHGLIDFIFGFDTLSTDNSRANESTLSELLSAIASPLIVLPLFVMGIVMIRKIDKESLIRKITLSNKNAA